MQVVYSILVEALIPLSLMGLIFGLILAVAAKFLEVKKDERLEKITQALPGINCGACGFAGCAVYAAAVATGKTDLTLCLPGGKKVAETLADLLDRKVEYRHERMVAQVCCKGGKGKALFKYIYDGLADCNALHALYGGNKVCPYGCLGEGSCIRVCPVEAITYDGQGLVWVNKERCIQCGKCLAICPTHVIQYIPYTADYFVACNSTDKAITVKKYCSVACTGCTLCENKSPAGGFKIDNFLARIDYSKTGERVTAAKSCPAQCIIPNPAQVQMVTAVTVATDEPVIQTSNQQG